MYMVAEMITMIWKNGQGRRIFCPWSFPLWCFLWELQSSGSRRWLSLGPLSFQPSEVAETGVILFLARTISRREKKKGMLELFRTLVLILPIVGLVGNQ